MKFNSSTWKNGAKLFATFLILFILSLEGFSQCTTALGDEVTYGSGSWIGYAYDGEDNFASADYQGFFTESETFDESFCGSDCDFTINGCDINTQTFSVRFRMNQTYTCGEYTITVGGDDGYRLSLDGGSTYIIDDYEIQSYATSSVVLVLDGNYDMVLEYFESGASNRVSFDITGPGSTASGGSIITDQTLCATSSDPAELTSETEASDCAGNVPAYQWQSSTDNINFSDISGATSNTYDPPSLLQTTYFRRNATLGASTVSSNTVTVTIQATAGDQVTQGAGSWIGYVYDGTANFTTDYRGEIFESEIFDEEFGGRSGTLSTSGCDVDLQSFSVRFLMERTFTCGLYTITVGGDDAYRLSLDGGTTYLIDDFVNGAYRTTTESVVLDGTYNMVLDYYDDGGENRITYTFTSGSVNDGGEIAADQSICSTTGSIDPELLTNERDASFCGSTGTITYQWQESTDGVNFADISGATSTTLDPDPVSATTYYQRVATLGADSETSNVVTVTLVVPSGDQATYGSGSWIGYVYEGSDNFASADYIGEIFETEEFDEEFGGVDVTASTSSCDFNTTTFSVRFLMNQTFASGDYTFRVGGDDGYRLSLDGGSTYVIDNYSDHAYQTTDATVNLDGNYNLVLDYYEGGADNRVSFEIVSVTLPVDLTLFQAVKEEDAAVLYWETASELNNDYFDIERSKDGRTFEPVGRVNGHGTTSVAQQYQWSDKSAPFGLTYYRLKQVDFDGNFEYSPIVFVENTSRVAFAVFPNPSAGLLTVQLSDQSDIEEVSCEVLDLSGKLIVQKKSTISNGRFNLSLKHLKSGTYYLQMNTGRSVIRERVIIR